MRETMQKQRGGLVIHEPAMVEVHVLNQSAYNPNKMQPNRYESLKASMLLDGFVEPIVVQKNGMRIIGGHHRVRAVREISIEGCSAVPKIPATILDIDDDAAKRLNLKLNNLRGEPDAQLLGELLADIYRVPESFVEEDVELLGLEQDDALKYLRLIDPEFAMGEVDVKTDEPQGFAKAPTLSLEFSSAGMRDLAKATIFERAEMAKTKTGDFLIQLLGLGENKKKKRVD